MTTQAIATPTAGRFLFGPEGSTLVSADIEDRVAKDAMLGGVAKVSKVGIQVVVSELCATLDKLLDLDLGTLLGAGWSSYDALIAAAEHTSANPASSEVVELGHHTITSVHHPSIDVLADDFLMSTLACELTLTFDVHAVVAVVRNGYLIAARPSNCELAASLSWHEFKYAPPARQLQLPGELSFGKGFRLVPQPPSP